MASITIRNLDDAVVAALKARAKAHHRSLEGELRQILGDAVSGPSADDLRTLAQRVAALTPAVPQSDSAALLRETGEG
ncbi:MAG: Arc family DNA-binding protein [Alphaproteobacteria bacterium]|nr:Arc family DNA-binding protein [Alphaproteobacteria bacterium]